MKTQPKDLKKKYSKEIFQLINGPWKLTDIKSENKFFQEIEAKIKSQKEPDK